MLLLDKDEPYFNCVPFGGEGGAYARRAGWEARRCRMRSILTWDWRTSSRSCPSTYRYADLEVMLSFLPWVDLEELVPKDLKKVE